MKMIIGKPGSHKRALRRHHDKRKKVWVRKTLGHYFMYATDLSKISRGGCPSEGDKKKMTRAPVRFSEPTG